ncbi:ABC transporter substrate-binding protein [Leucobacter luti]|uniref:Peptide/nickel transport system substrate-binding protein n=1 Tax=Leucobacter luti TaxID=340320 RepID=A0A4Q7U975_9MICO|nr:ABC transporter substrate-binding protein [Leucobacter luti]MBL3700977.1 ABC transporter substrate-binding protein [Leucobacter luti]RZT68802.1 peptide/nickel transport system substrate-binding protein [Leucobacter luti]
MFAVFTRRRGGALLAGLAVAGLALTGCSAQGDGAAAGTPLDWELTDQTAAPSGDIDQITWASYSEPYSLDYAYAFDYADNQVLANVCESLLRLNPDFTLTPGLAESFANPTPTTWVYQIREGVKFHDGTELTAADAVASMSRHLDPEVGSSWYSVYQNVASIEQTGDREVTVTTTIPDSQFNLGMGGAAGVIESAATLAELGADYGNSTGGVNCTGPMQFESWKSGEKLELSRFADYWDPELAAHSETFSFVFMGDATARTNALKSGEVDGTWLLPMDAAKSIQDAGTGDVLFGMNTSVSNLVVSNLEGPLGDVRVRKALLMAIDREGILQAMNSGVGEVTDVHTTRSVWGESDPAATEAAFADIEEYPFDVAAAKQLVEEAGATGEQLTLVTAPISQDFAIVSQATAAAAKAIGLDVTIDTVTPSAYTALFSDPSAREGVDLFYTIWYLSSPDPLEMYGVLRTDEFSNYGNWSNPDFDALVTEAVSTMDPIERSTLTAQAQQIANAELPWLPLAETPTAMFMGERVTGLSPSISYLYFPWAATLGAR